METTELIRCAVLALHIYKVKPNRKPLADPEAEAKLKAQQSKLAIWNLLVVAGSETFNEWYDHTQQDEEGNSLSVNNIELTFQSWYNHRDKTIWTVPDDKDAFILDSVGRKGRNVMPIITASLSRILYELLDRKPELKWEAKYRTCFSKNVKCINYFRVPKEEKPVDSLRDDPESPCMGCRACGFVDETEVLYYNAKRSRDSGDYIDAFGRAHVTDGYVGVGYLPVTFNIDPEKVARDDAEEHGVDIIAPRFKHGLKVIQKMRDRQVKKGAFIEDPAFVKSTYGCVATDETLAEMTPEEREQLYDDWLTAECKKLIAKGNAIENGDDPFYKLPYLDEEECEDPVGDDITPEETPASVTEYMPIQRPVTIENLRESLAWSTAATCPYFANYSWPTYMDEHFVPGRFWIQAANVALTEKVGKRLLKATAGPVDIVFDMGVADTVFLNRRIDNTEIMFHESREILDEAGYLN